MNTTLLYIVTDIKSSVGTNFFFERTMDKTCESLFATSTIYPFWSKNSLLTFPPVLAPEDPLGVIDNVAGEEPSARNAEERPCLLAFFWI